MRYMIFNIDGNYTDEDGEPCSLNDHLDYLERWGGTPDMWNSYTTLAEAFEDAKTCGFRALIVDDIGTREIEEVDGRSDETKLCPCGNAIADPEHDLCHACEEQASHNNLWGSGMP